jgi:hypothetical protein
VQVPRWHRNPWCCAALHSFTNTFEATSFSYWFDKPWFHTEGKLAAALIIPSSWGSQLTCDVQALFLALLPGRYSLVNLALATRFLAPLPGKTELLLQGESLTPNLFTLLFVLLSLFLFSLVCSLYQKHKKISYLFNSV